MSNRQTAVPLQSKVSLTLLLLIAAFVVISYTILQNVIAPAFERLEVADAEADLRRAEAAIQTDLENLGAATADWASWNDIHDFVTGRNPDFPRSNLDRLTLENLGIDLLVIFAKDHRRVWGLGLEDGEVVNLETLRILDPTLPESKSLTAHSTATAQVAGLVQSEMGPMLISSRPILRSDSSGPVVGALIMGQRLDEDRLARLRDRTEVDMGWAFGAAGLQSAEEISVEEGSISGLKVLPDIYDAPYLVLGTQTPRSISLLGARTINAATLFLVIGGTLACAFTGIMLNRTILRPVERLTAHVDAIRQSGDLSRKVSMQRNDEIGRLARQFDSMTTEVNSARRALLEQSFNAGKADMAAEVMHNLRNAMTPVINGLERLRDSFSVTENLRVEEAVDQLSDTDCTVDRKRQILEYIRVSFVHVRTINDSASAELGTVTAQARQVAGILSEQEKLANVAPVAENVAVSELLGEAANILPQDETHGIELSFDEHLAAAKVRGHRIGLLQVMGNLILNAYESIVRSGKRRGEIVFAASDELVDDRKMVRVTVRDNGSGFDPSTETEIFRRGFSSKTDGGSSGLGLHWCANAVAGMGGKISAESDGEGRGAEFHVLLPAADL